MKNDVAILIVTYNSEDQIRECLQSVLAERQSLRQEIIVVDNASSDGTVSLIRNEFPCVQLITPGANLGFAAGSNLAARHANAEFLLFLNPDTLIVDHAIDRVVEFARKNPKYGFYGGRTLTLDGRLEPSSCWGAPSLWSLAMFATGLSTLAPRNRLLDPESLGNWKRDSIREVGVITGCFLAVAREAWQVVGGFDERYWMYGEDVDLAIRARKAGYRPVIFPDAQLVHEVGQSSARPIDKMMLLFRGKAQLARAQWGGIAQNLSLILLAAGVGLRGLIAKSKGGDDRWQILWERRYEWLGGYADAEMPAAEPVAAVQPAKLTA